LHDISQFLDHIIKLILSHIAQSFSGGFPNLLINRLLQLFINMTIDILLVTNFHNRLDSGFYKILFFNKTEQNSLQQNYILL